MTEITKKPYSWIKSIPSALLQNDSIPLIGFPPPFPWEAFAKRLSQILEIKDLNISHEAFQWRTKGELLAGMGDRVHPMHFGLTPLSGTLCWLLAEEDITQMMALLLKMPSTSLATVNRDFQEGFYRFLAMECIDALMGLDFSKKLSPRILNITDLPEESTSQFLCMDVTITLNGHTILGRAVLSSDLRNECKERFARQSLEETLSQPHVQNLEIPLHLEAGRTSIKRSEWAQITVGDFLVLDFCSLRPNEDGRILLTINHIPFFRGKIKDGNIKILEHPLYYEVGTAVDKNNKEDSFQEDYSVDEDEEEFENEEEFEGEDESEDEEEDNEEFSGEEEAEEEEVTENFDEDYQEEQPSETPEAIATVEEAQKPMTIEDVTLSVIVEVGRLQMSVKQLMELQPGNLLESNIRPENGVDLIVNGKCIAKGELLLVGETLGVRILELG